MKKSLIALIALFVLLAPGRAGAQTLDSIADELNLTGRYIEGATLDSTTEAAVDAANSAGTAFVQLNAQDSSADAQNLLEGLLSRLNDSNSRYQSIVLYQPNNGAWAASNSGDPQMAIASAFDAFSAGNVAVGLKQYTDSLSGVTPDSTTATTSASTTSTTSSGPDVPWLWLFAVAAIGWLGFRLYSSRKASKSSSALIEADRKEIKEQLRDNADRVINLGDAVITRGDADLIRLYEDASRAYQDVSQEVDEAKTAEQIDALDDRIDTAEWQFEVIEATLEGRKPPERPTEPSFPPPPTARTRRASPPPPSPRSSRPAMEADDSMFDERTKRRARTKRTSGGGLGGFARSGIGSVLLSLLAQFVLGGGLNRSRRSYGRVVGSTTTGSRSSSNTKIKGPKGF